MGIESLSFNDICKSSNEFSFLSTIFDLVGNRQFKTAEYDSIVSKKDDLNTHIWISLSAIGQEIGGVFLQNINNFIDNLLNADTCGVHGLQSLANLLGINYTIFTAVNDFPNDIKKLIDVLSIKKEYLIDITQINRNFATYLCANCSSDVDETNLLSTALSINNYREKIKLSCIESNIDFTDLSNQWHTENVISNRYNTTYAPKITNRLTLSADLLNLTIHDIYYNFIMSKLTMTYNDVDSTEIYRLLSNNIILSNFTINNDKSSEINRLLTQYNISKKFVVATEADNIDNGLSTLDDYNIYELQLLDIEFNYRHAPFSELQLFTRNKYYKEIEVREYFNFIRNEYLNSNSTYLNDNVSSYNIDNEYFVISSAADEYKSLLDISCNIKTSWVESVVDDLTYITDAIRSLREQIKIFCQKNFMKGTYLLISYLINEYLKNTTSYNLNKLYNISSDLFKSKPQKFSFDSNYNYLVEYIDPINYFNICAEVDIGKTSFKSLSSDLSATINERYWLVGSLVKAIGAIDTTDVFSIPPTINANPFAFDIATLSSFYCNIMNLKFKLYSISKLSCSYSDHLSKFLSYIFDIGADSTYKDETGNLIFNIEDDELSTYKEDLYFRYTANANSEFPFYYYSNTYHPSYQIHPYLSSFMEKVDYSYPILNIATITRDSIISLVKANLSTYIDKDGYLQNIWNNPLGANQDYQSHYELVTHIDETNAINELIGYDGLFYPKAIEQIFGDLDFKNACAMLRYNLPNDSTLEQSFGLKNYYYHLSLTNNDRQKIINQLELFRKYFKNNLVFTENNYIIYRYGLDVYLNAYILVKNTKDSDGNILTKKLLANADGILWIRLKNHPIAFPAYVLILSASKYRRDDGYITTNDYSNIYSDYAGNSSLSNNVIWNKSKSTLQLIDGYHTVGIKDFSISINRHYITFVLNCINADKTTDVKITIAIVEKQYNELLEENLLTFNKPDDDRHIEFLFSNKGYLFGCFFNVDNYLAVCMYTYQLGTNTKKDTVTLIGNYYDCYNSNNPCKSIDKSTIELHYPVENNTDLCFDAINDDILTLGYVTTKLITNVTTYLGKEFDYTSDISTYLSRPLDKCIALKAFSINTSFTELELDSQSDDNTTALFDSYTDNGFFGILSGKNDVVNSALDTEMQLRGILKFQLVGPGKQKPIDFKLTIPVRMREGYKLKDVTSGKTALGSDIKYASYEYAHFEEDILSARNDAIAKTTILKYDPIELNKVLEGRSATLQVDEEFFNLIQDTESRTHRLYNNMLVGPYLVIGDIPTQYSKPGTLTYQADLDIYELLILDNHIPISVSWYYNERTKQIQLDFNTTYYNKYDKSINILNERRNFLALEKPGDAGYLNTYLPAEDIEDIEDIEDAIYYIKNISDTHPKFLLSATVYSDIGRLLIAENNKYIITEDNTKDYGALSILL